MIAIWMLEICACKPLELISTQSAFTCSKLTLEIIEQRYEICSKLTIMTPSAFIVLVSIFLTLNIFHTLF